MSQLQNTRSPKAEYRSIIGDVSFSVCLPKQYATGLGLQKGDYVKVTARLSLKKRTRNVAQE
jgi:hypothetical protein